MKTLFHSWQVDPSGQVEGSPGLQGRLQNPALQSSPGWHPCSSLSGNRSHPSPSFCVPWMRQSPIEGALV